MLKTRKDPIPCSLLDAYRTRMRAYANVTDALTLFQSAAASCELEVANVQKCVERIDTYYRKLREESKSSTGKKPKTFGSTFNKWVSDLNLEELLLACCTDYFEACRVYNEVDFEDAFQFINFRLTEKSQHYLYSMEAVMYGMGGHYKADKQSASPANTKVHDLATEAGRRSGREAMKRLGFLKNG